MQLNSCEGSLMFNLPKILYVSCHAVLEYDELRMFSDLGFPFFSLGSYINPTHPQIPIRPALINPKEISTAWESYHKMTHLNVCAGEPPEWHGKLFSKEFLDNFDIIILMHIPDWIERNWDVLKGRKVIWRTIGQSTPNVELRLTKCRKEGLKIVRYSPFEKNIRNYIGEDAIIRFGKYKEDFIKWIGSIDQVITVCQSMKSRSSDCNYDAFLHATRGFRAKIYGQGNENVEEWLRADKIYSYEHLKKVYSENAVYLYTGTKPSCYTLNFMEAMMTGIPIVSIGPTLSKFENDDYTEVPFLLDSCYDGGWSDDISQMKLKIYDFLNDRDKSQSASESLRAIGRQLFDATLIKKQWADFLTSI